MSEIIAVLIAFPLGVLLGAVAVAFTANNRRRQERDRLERIARALGVLCVENGVDRHVVHMQGVDPGWRPRAAASPSPLRAAMYTPPPPREPGRRGGGA